MITLSVKDIANLHATINSLRPVQKADEVPKEVLCFVHNAVPVFSNIENMAANLNVRPNIDVSLQTELTRPFTGLVLLAVSSERTRLSIALYPTEVTGLALNETYKFAFFPAPVLKFFSANKSAQAVLLLQQDRFIVSIQADLAGSNVKRTQQGIFSYVEDGDEQDGRTIFQNIPLQKGIRITGDEMLRTLRMVEPNLVTLAMHTYVKGRTTHQAFTVSCKGDMQYLATFMVNHLPLQTVVDLRDAGAASPAASAEPYDEDLEQLKAQCEAAPKTDDEMGELFLLKAREYIHAYLQPEQNGQIKRVKFATGKLGEFALDKPGEKYTLHAHGLVQSKQLSGLLADHAKMLAQGLTVLMGQQHNTSYIVLVMPLSGPGLVLHAVACSVAEAE